MISLAAIDAAWPAVEPEPTPSAQQPAEELDTEEPSGVRLRGAKPPTPLEAIAKTYLMARRELEDRLDSKQRVRVELGDDVYEVVMVADSIAQSGEVRRRGGLRVERVGGQK